MPETALENVKKTIARRESKIIKGRTIEGARGYQFSNSNILEEIKELSKIKNMNNSNRTENSQVGMVNIRRANTNNLITKNDSNDRHKGMKLQSKTATKNNRRDIKKLVVKKGLPITDLKQEDSVIYYTDTIAYHIRRWVNNNEDKLLEFKKYTSDEEMEPIQENDIQANNFTPTYTSMEIGKSSSIKRKLSKKDLKVKLKALRKKHIKRTTKLKAINNSDSAVNIILSYESTISNVSCDVGVPKEMIQAILYRELICYGMDDVVKDYAVRQYYTSKPIPFSYFDDICNALGLGKEMRDSSTGIGQIFAETAIKAEINVNDDDTLDPEDEDDLWVMWKKLQKDKNNIYYVALVLQSGAKDLKVDIGSLTRKERIKVFGKYNGNIAYGKHVIQYYDLFLMYNAYEVNDLIFSKV